jgi:hypothetical protein
MFANYFLIPLGWPNWHVLVNFIYVKYYQPFSDLIRSVMPKARTSKRHSCSHHVECVQRLLAVRVSKWMQCAMQAAGVDAGGIQRPYGLFVLLFVSTYPAQGECECGGDIANHASTR